MNLRVIILSGLLLAVMVLSYIYLSGGEQSMGAGANLLGIALGFILYGLLEEIKKTTQNKALWAFLNQEINFCASQASTYLKDKILAPAYRLPTKSYETAFPILLKDGEIASESDIEKIMRFFDTANQMNRILDILEKSLAENTQGREDDEITNKEIDEFERCQLKAEKIRKENGPYYEEAISVAKRRLKINL